MATLQSLAACLPLLALALAGCLGPTALSAGDADLAALASPGFLAPAVVGGGGGVETSFEIGPDGSALICEMGMGVANPVYGSTDGGATWRALDPLPAPDLWTNGDCDVAVAEDGTWWVVYGLATRTLPLPWPALPVPFRGAVGVGHTLVRSDDHGATWEVVPITPPRTGLVPPGVGHRPWLRATGDALYLTYYGVPMNPPGVQVLEGSAWFQRSLDRGATWDEPRVLATNPAFMGGGEFDLDEDGRTLRVPLAMRDPGADTVSYVVAESPDQGATWVLKEVLRQAPARFGVPSLARDALGAWYVPVPALAGDGVRIEVLVSKDDGATWSGPWPLAEGVDFGERSMGTVLTDRSPGGGVVVAWQHLVPDGGTERYTVSAAGVDAGASGLRRWSADLAPPLGVEAHLEFFAMAHDRDGRLHVVYPVPDGDCPEGGACVVHVRQA